MCSPSPSDHTSWAACSRSHSHWYDTGMNLPGRAIEPCCQEPMLESCCCHEHYGSYAVWLQVCNVRNAVISRLLPISNFMEHTLYDCGHL